MTNIKAILVPADETVDISLIEIDQDDYTQITNVIGGTFAGLDLYAPMASIFFHDEGKILDLPVNRRGTLLLWVHRTDFRGYDSLRGDVLILGPADDDGKTLTAPQELVDLLFNTEQWKYQVQVHGDKTWCGNAMTFYGWVDAYNGACLLADRWTLVEHVRVVSA